MLSFCKLEHYNDTENNVSIIKWPSLQKQGVNLDLKSFHKIDYKIAALAFLLLVQKSII